MPHKPIHGVICPIVTPLVTSCPALNTARFARDWQFVEWRCYNQPMRRTSTWGSD
ncbi:MAG: hypothetical protein OXE46_09570 [Chloroflexi bacterium]|nr:hypothetical protein [Chloroflexota bacterium]